MPSYFRINITAVPTRPYLMFVAQAITASTKDAAATRDAAEAEAAERPHISAGTVLLKDADRLVVALGTSAFFPFLGRIVSETATYDNDWWCCYCLHR